MLEVCTFRFEFGLFRMILSSKFALVPDSGSSHHDQLHSWRGYVALGIASFRKRFISPRPGVYTVSQLTNPRRMFTESSIVGDLVAVDGPERKGEIVAEEMKIGLCEKKEEKKSSLSFRRTREIALQLLNVAQNLSRSRREIQRFKSLPNDPDLRLRNLVDKSFADDD